MAVAIDILSWALLLSGGFFVVVGGIGVLRLPDLYTRMHAAGVTDTAGAALILVGLMLQAGFTLITVKLLLILLFLWFTSPTASYALANSALFDGVKPLLHKRGADKDDG
ncbi:MAG: monovalent cation/H(+) antiporter subunit G [Minwuiales bacterium]|nr:monovalent cation/H(+) antiporter subunit G [Minwuiales bacterium]